MQLILWRHAEAEAHSVNDLTRKLTSKGHKQAQKAAQHMQTLIPKNTTICVSEAVRSQQTALYLQRQITLLPELNPDAYATDLLAILPNYQNHECLIWVGHQPWIGHLSSYLLTKKCTDIWIKKGAFWHFELTWLAKDYLVKLRSVVSK